MVTQDLQESWSGTEYENYLFFQSVSSSALKAFEEQQLFIIIYCYYCIYFFFLTSGIIIQLVCGGPRREIISDTYVL